VDGIREQSPLTGQSFCEQLMKEEGVALVPGAAFADDRWVRLSYAVSDEELEKGLDRILHLIQRLASAPAMTAS
jgi:aspartate/methionine/tyrosine aminotransferase